MRSSLYQASMVAMSRPDMIQDAWKAKWIWFPFHGPPKDGFAGNLACALSQGLQTRLFGFPILVLQRHSFFDSYGTQSTAA